MSKNFSTYGPGRGPDTPPVIRVESIRQGGQAGFEYQLRYYSDVIVRVIGDEVTIMSGYDLDGDEWSLQLSLASARAIVKVLREWRHARKSWVAFGGEHRVPFRGLSPILYYRPGQWEPKPLLTPEEVHSLGPLRERFEVRPGEGTIGGSPVRQILIGGTGEQAGAVVEGPEGLCLRLDRACAWILRRWPREPQGFDPTQSPIVHEDDLENTALLDAVTLYVLEEAVGAPS